MDAGRSRLRRAGVLRSRLRSVPPRLPRVATRDLAAFIGRCGPEPLAPLPHPGAMNRAPTPYPGLDQLGQRRYPRPMNPVNIYDAKTHLSELVQRAAAGEEIVIARNGKPAARLVALAGPAARRPGGWEGQVWRAPDFDEADATLATLMLGGESHE